MNDSIELESNIPAATGDPEESQPLKLWQTPELRSVVVGQTAFDTGVVGDGEGSELIPVS
jgi:hypothetical protein